eukprot:TRINITY_DN2249_c0_g1_i2.p1 TRINITY_DN2249_c0_g1~~TRINITY_DN2249_c0_g1_i2.p1  ORF type:complete len:1532 (+),score=404.05 TRINITY_DN2249_c0_g1_i2:123-4718(+)
MPCILKIRVVEARSLPVMDRSTELADAYVEVKFADGDPQRTEICRKTLNPVWNEDFRFEVPNDSMLQDEPLELKVWDYDVVSSNDIIGVVYLDLNTLLNRDAIGHIAGWFPIYDTLRGIRGQLFVSAKLEFFLNVNPFKDASAGVRFFSIDTPFSNYRITHLAGFVSELIVEDDPEYHWVDTFRASRISNTERQLLLYRLSGKLRRQLGCRVLDMGGNAVLGYRQQFDLEGDTGIIARGYGTAVRLKRLRADNPSSMLTALIGTSSNPSPTLSPKTSAPPTRPGSPSFGIPSSPSPATLIASSPRAMEVTIAPPPHNVVPLVRPDEFYAGISLLTPPQDVVLLTLAIFQANIITHIGGVVSARSIKLLESSRKSDTREARDQWWGELRSEVKAHARSLGCMFVVGYSETTTIQIGEELCVLSATGTAVRMNVLGTGTSSGQDQPSSSNTAGLLVSAALPPSGPRKERERRDRDRDDPDKDADRAKDDGDAEEDMRKKMKRKKSLKHDGSEVQVSEDIPRQRSKPSSLSASAEDQDTWAEFERRRTSAAGLDSRKSSLQTVPPLTRLVARPQKHKPCRIAHIPYSQADAPFPMRLVRCSVCHKRFVPEMVLSTIDPPPGTPITGRGVLVEARVARPKKKVQGEANATLVSEALPFLEYDVHRQLAHKLKVLGMNAVFGLKLQVTVGDAMLVGLATATAVFLTPLPPPPVLHISRNTDIVDEEDKKLLAMQRKIEMLSKQNKVTLQGAGSTSQPDVMARYFPETAVTQPPPQHHHAHPHLHTQTQTQVQPQPQPLPLQQQSSHPPQELLATPQLTTSAAGPNVPVAKDAPPNTPSSTTLSLAIPPLPGPALAFVPPPGEVGLGSTPPISDLLPRPVPAANSPSLPFNTSVSSLSSLDETPKRSKRLDLGSESPLSFSPLRKSSSRDSPSSSSSSSSRRRSRTKKGKKGRYQPDESGSSENDEQSSLSDEGTRKRNRRLRARARRQRASDDSSSDSSRGNSSDDERSTSSNTPVTKHRGDRRARTRRRAKHVSSSDTSSDSSYTDTDSYTDSDSDESYTSEESSDGRSRRRRRGHRYSTDDDEPRKYAQKSSRRGSDSTDKRNKKKGGRHKERVSSEEDEEVASIVGSSAKVSDGYDSSSSDSSVAELGLDKSASVTPAFVVEVDDEMDEDTMAVLLDPPLPPGFSLCNTQILPGNNSKLVSNLQLVSAVRRVELDIASGHLTQKLSAQFHHLYSSLMFKLRLLTPCCVCALKVDISLPEDDQVQLLITAMAVMEEDPHSISPPISLHSSATPIVSSHGVSQAALSYSLPNLITNSSESAVNDKHLGRTSSSPNKATLSRSLDKDVSQTVSGTSTPRVAATPLNMSQMSLQGQNNEATDLQFDISPPPSPLTKSQMLDVDRSHTVAEAAALLTSLPGDHVMVELTPLSFLPNMKMERYVGRVNIHFIKETFTVKDGGGLGNFTHVFLTEANAIIRAHVAGMGGNALVGYRIEEFIIVEATNKDQAYSLISLSGDAFCVKGDSQGFKRVTAAGSS